MVACLVGKSKVGYKSCGRSWGRQVLWGNGFQLAQGCPPEDILEIGGGDWDYCYDLVGGPEGGHPVTCRTVLPNKELTHLIFRCLAGYLCM